MLTKAPTTAATALYRAHVTRSRPPDLSGQMGLADPTGTLPQGDRVVTSSSRGGSGLPTGSGWDTLAGTIELAIPKLCTGSYFRTGCWNAAAAPSGALISVVATSYLPGCRPAGGEAGRADNRR